MFDAAGGEWVLPGLMERLEAEDLRVVLPLGRAGLDAVAGVPLRLAERRGAWSAVLVGDGGGAFFARFSAAVGSGADLEQNPLDGYTRRRVQAAVAEAVGTHGIPYEIYFPFATEPVHLPFQRLGQAAGLPPPGPLGVQVHPLFGPWWAYRALILLATSLAPGDRMKGACDDCPGPCVNDCQVHRVGTDGGGEVRRRWTTGTPRGPIVCGDGCGARLRCPVGAAFQYPAAQIAFHARARRAAAFSSGA